MKSPDQSLMGLWLQSKWHGTVPTLWTYIMDEEKDQVSERSNHNLGSRSMETSQRHCTGSRGTLGIYTQGDENDCHCPINCFICFAILCPKYTIDFQNFRKLEEKRGTEKIIGVAISTAIRYSLWIEIWDCTSPEIFNQQPTGIVFPFGPEGKGDRSWFFLCKSLGMIRAEIAQSLMLVLGWDSSRSACSTDWLYWVLTRVCAV